MTHNKQIINKKIKINKKKILIFADIETIIIDNKHNPYMIAWIHESNKKYFFVDSLTDIKEYVIIKKFLNAISSIENPNKSKIKTIFFHNMSNFDGWFFLKFLVDNNIQSNIIERNNIIYQIKFTYKGETFFLQDSYLIIPISLKEIGTKFTNTTKDDFAIEKININNLSTQKELIIKYCLKDVHVLKIGFQTFRDLILKRFNYDILNSLSLSSIAFNIFRINYYDIENTPIYKNTIEYDEFIRKSYIGGLTEVYKPHLKQGMYYDINSLYPFAMTLPLPIGKGRHKILKKNDLEYFFGFVKAIIKTPNVNKPFLPYRNENDQIINPIGTYSGIYFSEELKFAKDLGYEIFPLEGIEFKSGYPLKEFSEQLYKERQSYVKKDPMNLIVKLILNSLYGRFGMKIEMYHNKILEKKLYKKYEQEHNIVSINEINENYISIKYIKKSIISKGLHQNILTNFDINTAVHIASAITSYARIHMHKYKNNNNTYYTDTDAIFTDKELPKENIGNQLGQMRLESKVKEAYFIAPKSYIYIDDNNKKKIIFKGVDNNIKNKLSIDFFKDMLKKDNETKLSWTRYKYFKKNYNTLDIEYSKTNIINQIPFNKRLKVFKNDIWTDTTSIKIHNIDTEKEDL